MLQILFLIIIFIVLWPLLRLPIAFVKMFRRARRAEHDSAFNQAYSRMYRDQSAWGGSRRQQEPSQPRRAKKVFGRNDGEYVEFEEITETISDTTSARTDETRYETEQQVSDAEWEEIK